ncbi:MAG TPA: sterol desaturase family protein [Ilumatobacteraceae bacterium]|nr:sterol desaturase family protein [Ilumatobacteraceae bacterium]
MDTLAPPLPASRAVLPLPTGRAILPPPDPSTRHVPTRRLWRRILVSLFAAGAIVAGIALGYEPIGALVGLFLILRPIEKLWPRHRTPLRRLGLRTDITHLLLTPVTQIAGIIVGVAIGVASFAWLPGLALRPFVTALPFWAQAGLGFLLLDLTVYWIHRMSHEVPFFWRFHAVHHSAIHLDWISGVRAHPFDGVFGAPAIAFLLGAGVSLEITGALAVLQVVTGLWAHLNVRWRLRPLHRVVLTPDFHHWHHANERDAINTNYAGLLPIWDQLFGTYFMPPDRTPSSYGIDEPMPLGVWGQLRQPFRRRPDATMAG